MRRVPNDFCGQAAPRQRQGKQEFVMGRQQRNHFEFTGGVHTLNLAPFHHADNGISQVEQGVC